ncbi:leucyl aminopeptidase [bacterium]|nr:MAG: leucyl aminopeptidase [bacterium]
MKFITTSEKISQIKTDALIVFLAQDKTLPEEKLLDKHLAGKLAAMRKSKDFLGEAKDARLLFEKNNLPRVILAGLGRTADLNLEAVRNSVSSAFNILKSLPIKNAAVIVPSLPRIKPADTAQTIAETLELSAYEFNHYKSEPTKSAKIDHVQMWTPSAGQKRAIDEAVKHSQIITQSIHFARDLGNHPSNVATPSHLAHHALELAKKQPQIKVRILHKKDIEKEKMGALLSVARGSDEEPKFIIMEYSPKKTAPLVALVGKGITFDSGGISIKPSDKMEEMKFDMSGGATVMAIIKAAAELKLPINLIGLVPATENLPSGKATKPGDVIRSRSGATIEIVNTDAEGRVILADALDFAKQYQPDLVIDFATLTGSIMVALGDEIAGAFSNAKSQLDRLQEAAAITGEKIWPMPLEKTYEEFIKSDVADLRNIGTVRYGDSINAANFLQHFVDYPWIHLDIAGVAWTTREKPYRPKGATGTGIRLAIEFLKKFKS